MNALECAEKASEIFVLSDSFVRIKELIDDDSSTIDDISDVILLDPGLSGTILKLANSSLFNYPGKIDTISKAVLVLGITEVYNLVIAYFTTDAFKSISADADFLENFWEEAVDCALLIKFLGDALNLPNAERLFILGILHNLGELVVQQCMPAKIGACHDFSVTELPWDKQRSILSFTYGECSGELLKLWHLPYSLVEPVRDQDFEDFEFASIDTQLLYIAKRIMLFNHQCKDHTQSSLLNDEIIEDLQITQKVIDMANNFCDMERLSILALLNPSAAMIY